MLTKEAWEKWSKLFETFEPWLNETEYDEKGKLLDTDEKGLKEGAPDEARAAYAEFQASEKRDRESGRK